MVFFKYVLRNSPEVDHCLRISTTMNTTFCVIVTPHSSIPPIKLQVLLYIKLKVLLQQSTDQSVDYRISKSHLPGQYVAGHYKMHCSAVALHKVLHIMQKLSLA